MDPLSKLSSSPRTMPHHSGASKSDLTLPWEACFRFDEGLSRLLVSFRVWLLIGGIYGIGNFTITTPQNLCWRRPLTSDRFFLASWYGFPLREILIPGCSAWCSLSMRVLVCPVWWCWTRVTFAVPRGGFVTIIQNSIWR